MITNEEVFAHAFGSRYDLPLPLWLYVTGAGSAVALSFVVMSLFIKPASRTKIEYHYNLLQIPFLRLLCSRYPINSIKILSILVFGLILLTGYFSNPKPINNFASIFIWVIWWVGMAFISALLGNFWAITNPLANIFQFFHRNYEKHTGFMTYPTKLGHWPVVVLLFVFAWMELISGFGEDPRALSTIILIYSVITWTGMSVFGYNAWLKHGEVFHSIFNLLSRFAPTYGRAGKWFIRVPASGLIPDRPAQVSKVFFILLLLSTVTFDGILETPFWMEILKFISESIFLRPFLVFLDANDINIIVLIKTVALITFPSFFFFIYAGFCHVIAEFGSGGRIPTNDILGYFIYSIVPIAIAYHLAHYLSYILIAGQQIIPILSDPFNIGWDLIKTSDYQIDIGIINAKFVWYNAVFAIVIGHIFAVYIGHRIATKIFTDQGAAIRSQYPMMVLMIGYTMLSLWILSQPIVE